MSTSKQDAKRDSSSRRLRSRSSKFIAVCSSKQFRKLIVFLLICATWLKLLLLWEDAISGNYLQSESGSKHQQNTNVQHALENKNPADRTASPELYKPVDEEQENAPLNHPVARQNQTTITTNVTATDMTTTRRPCRVAVTNSRDAIHFETLESIASLFPLHALNFSLSQCDPQNMEFDYYLYAPAWSERVQRWGEYFETTLKGAHVSIPQAADNVTRRIGVLHKRHGKGARGQLTPFRKYPYDASIEATCYCTWSQVNWMMTENLSCVFHERCPEVAANPLAVWLSPHHKNYYIPSALPGALQSQQQQQQQQQPLQFQAKKDTPHKLCVVGDSRRRSWGLLKGYLESNSGANAIASSRFIIQILSVQRDYPEALEMYRNMTTKESHVSDGAFYRAARQCDGLLVLVSKENQPDYFDTADSKLKLSGAIPIVIAYQLPVVIHEELYDLYQDHLSSLTHATHSDSGPSFNAAMNQLLDALDANEKARAQT